MGSSVKSHCGLESHHTSVGKSREGGEKKPPQDKREREQEKEEEKAIKIIIIIIRTQQQDERQSAFHGQFPAEKEPPCP